MKHKAGRTLSSGDVLAYANAVDLSRNTADDQPVHQPNESLLCTESGFTNFRGLINWGLIMMLIFGGKLALTNLLSNGIIVDPFIWRFILRGEHARLGGLLFIASSNIFILAGYVFELLFAKFDVPQFIVLFLVILNQISLVIFPSILIISHDWSPFFSAPCMMLYVIVFLKLWSYAQVNSWCRAAIKRRNQGVSHEVASLLKPNYSVLKRRKADASVGKTTRAISTIKEPAELRSAASVGDVLQDGEAGKKDNGNQIATKPREPEIFLHSTHYPDNLTLSDLYYFMFAPTLCYELSYPRTFTIRRRFLIKRLLELLCLSQVIIMLIQQWMVPGLKSSVTPFIRSRWITTLDRLLNIAIPNHIIWLLGFYALFHSFLNVLAELMKFADRSFYKDWWNASSVTAFWSSWNIPVHRWCLRHIYKPMLIHDYSRFTASCVVFIVSAFFHELMVSVPLKMFRLWAFFVMLGQQPYAILVHYYCPKGGKLGNMAMWLTLIVGQPLALFMYFHDYYILRYH